jgi:hypothetical protein
LPEASDYLPHGRTILLLPPAIFIAPR